MYIKRSKYPVMSGEPHLGTVTEAELFEKDGEGLDILIETMVENQGVPEEFTREDDITGETITLRINEYLTNEQIDWLNEAFIEDDEWNERQLKFMLERI